MVRFTTEMQVTDEARSRFEKIVENAKQTKRENEAPARDKNWFKRFVKERSEPIFIGGSEYIGTHRARANHVDACIHFFEEQVALKTLGKPIV